MSEITSTFRLTIMGLMIISGAINTIAYKFQNTQYVHEGGHYKLFFHPYMQATTMFFGQFLALFVFMFMKRRNPQEFKKRQVEAEAKGKIVKFNKLWLAIPAIGDFITSTLHYVALNFISGSVYQMLRGGGIVTTLMFSVIFLKSRVMRNQIFGAGFVLLGVMIVGLSNILFKDSSSDGASPGLQIVGYLLIILSLFTNSFQFVFQEKLLSKFHLEPLQVVGYEGMFGLAIELCFLPILTFIPCSFGVEACVFNYRGMPYLERPQRYFAEIASNGVLLLFVILGVFSIATFNICGVTVTKYINALARSIGDVTRTVIIWAVGIIITVTAGASRPNFQWELVKAGAILVQLLGFVILVCGNLIYNKVIKLPFITPNNQDSLLLQNQRENAESLDTIQNQENTRENRNRQD